MTSAIPVERVDFASGGDRCAAWLTLPSSPGPHPAVVLVHGLGATRDMMLPLYEQHFAAAGIAVLSFDYRFTGASGGQPRQRISIPEQCRDVGAAIDFLKRHPRVDAGRIGLWGTSLGGMNVVRRELNQVIDDTYLSRPDELAAGEVTVKALRDGAGAQTRQPLANVAAWAGTLKSTA